MVIQKSGSLMSILLEQSKNDYKKNFNGLIVLQPVKVSNLKEVKS